MGRPINKRYFGSGPGNQIKIRAKIGSNAEGDGFIVRQKGTNKFIVTVGDNTGVCRVANKDSGTLEANEMIINVLTDAGIYVQATKLYNRVAIIEGNTKIKWNFAADLTDGSVQVIDVEGPTLAFSTQPSSLTRDLGDQDTGTGFSFTAVATGVPAASITYTWQLSTDGGSTWTTINNGGVYSGATTTTLTVASTDYEWDGYQYRAVATSAGVSGSPLASTAAVLTVVSTYQPE
jgi:hypothetical protein